MIKIPMCTYEDCYNSAVYEFIDTILADPSKKIKDRKLKKVVIAHSCDIHYRHIENKYIK